MSTCSRYVAVKLIAGKKYVLRNGRHVTVQENPHWQCRANYPFVVIEGTDFVVYYDETGSTGGAAHEHDIMRPLYEEGQTYVNGRNIRVTVNYIDKDTCLLYPVHGDNGEEYLLDGRYLSDGAASSWNNLFDYEHPPAVFALPPAPVAASWVGKRVHFTEDGYSGAGLVLRELPHAPGRFEVRADAPFNGHGTGGLKWHVYAENLRVADANTGVTAAPSIIQDALPDLMTLATLTTPLRVGMRVEVQLDCGTTVQATIMHEDASHVAIEFDPDYYHEGAWTCAGLVPSGRGWFVPRDSVRAVSEAETQVEAKCSESLTEVDVIEIWGAYRINPTIDIESWIAARRKLNAAAK